jgi:hypothetical protein
VGSQDVVSLRFEFTINPAPVVFKIDSKLERDLHWLSQTDVDDPVDPSKDGAECFLAGIQRNTSVIDAKFPPTETLLSTRHRMPQHKRG